MGSSAEVTAAEIGRLAGVGRAAVSNWRRRYADFPEPVGGTAASPAFRLADVEQWLRTNDKLPQRDPLNELVLALRHLEPTIGGPEQQLSTLASELIRPRKGRSDLPSAVRPALAAALSRHDPHEIFEYVLERSLESRSRRSGVLTPPALSQLIVGLFDVIGATVLDPACGGGSLLHGAAEAGAARLRGQSVDHDLLALCTARLRVLGAQHDTRVGGLSDDAFADLRADVVVCHPPFNERDWGYDQLTYDPRWEYGLPPRSESELAWVQHCVARLRAGGQAAVLLPPSVASRTAGRRVRNSLLRKGALRAVIALPPAAGAPLTHLPLHVWLLARPELPEARRDLLLVDAARHEWPAAAAAIRRVVSAYLADGRVPAEARGLADAVPVIDLIDEEMDLNPARHLAVEPAALDPAVVRRQVASLRRRLATLSQLLPDFDVGEVPAATRSVSVAELLREGAVTMLGTLDSAPRTGDVHVSGPPRPRATVVRPGESTVPSSGQLLRPDPKLLDPWFLAGFVVRSANVRAIFGVGSMRLDLRRAQLPHLPLPLQQVYGRLFERLDQYDRAVGEVSALSTEVTQLIAEGLVARTLSGRA